MAEASTGSQPAREEEEVLDPLEEVKQTAPRSPDGLEIGLDAFHIVAVYDPAHAQDTTAEVRTVTVEELMLEVAAVRQEEDKTAAERKPEALDTLGSRKGAPEADTTGTSQTTAAEAHAQRTRTTVAEVALRNLTIVRETYALKS